MHGSIQGHHKYGWNSLPFGATLNKTKQKMFTFNMQRDGMWKLWVLLGYCDAILTHLKSEQNTQHFAIPHAFPSMKMFNCSNVSFKFGLEGSVDDIIVSSDEWLCAMYTESADINMLCAIMITTPFNDWADYFLWADKSSRHISNNAKTWNNSFYIEPSPQVICGRQTYHYMLCASAIRDMAPPM